jgi:hypothetical protein
VSCIQPKRIGSKRPRPEGPLSQVVRYHQTHPQVDANRFSDSILCLRERTSRTKGWMFPIRCSPNAVSAAVSLTYRFQTYIDTWLIDEVYYFFTATGLVPGRMRIIQQQNSDGTGLNRKFVGSDPLTSDSEQLAVRSANRQFCVDKPLRRLALHEVITTKDVYPPIGPYSQSHQGERIRVRLRPGAA